MSTVVADASVDVPPPMSGNQRCLTGSIDAAATPCAPSHQRCLGVGVDVSNQSLYADGPWLLKFSGGVGPGLPSSAALRSAAWRQPSSTNGYPPLSTQS